MPTVAVTLPHHRYDVFIEPGVLARLGELVREVVPSASRAAMIVDEGFEPHGGRDAARAMHRAGIDTTVAVMTPSEKKKSLGTVRSLLEVLLEARLERGHAVVAVGGGITGDTGGFVAAIYLRGVPLIQVPTTLLAMVDASVGGKVGVNVPRGKNLIGAFHQPSRVIIDPEVLVTLPPRELRCGLAECVKHGMIRDPDLFHWTRENAADLLALDMPTLTELIERNVRIKAAVVEADEREAGERAHLNFGHTFAHAIEATSRYGTRYKHGEAVALGMVAATRFALARKLCPPDTLDALTATLAAVELPTRSDSLPPVPLLIKAMRMDKKVRDGRVRLVLPTRIGGVTLIDDAAPDEVAAAWQAVAA